MPEIPPEVYAAIDAALDQLPQPEKRFERDRWRIVSRVALEAAAPLLANEIAQKILAHMNEHGANPATVNLPQAAAMRAYAYRRHFETAARIAAGAFYTREDQLRLAAEAIERGDFIGCVIPEVPDA